MDAIYIGDSGVSISLQSTRPYFLQSVDVGAIRQAVNTFKAPHQDGAFYISGSMEMRNITLEGTILTDTVAETIAAQRAFLRAFTPKGRGAFVYRDLQIPCYVEEASFVSTGIARAPSFFVSLLCPSPFFEAIHERVSAVALWLDNFSFELEIPEDTGIELGIRQQSQIIEVDNDGDVPCGCVIQFNALGTVEKPEVMNTDTGEIMRINRSMVPGEQIHVYTHFAGKRVISVLNGQETNCFGDIDPASVFLQLAPGENALRYDAATGIDALEVHVRYRPLML